MSFACSENSGNNSAAATISRSASSKRNRIRSSWRSCSACSLSSSTLWRSSSSLSLALPHSLSSDLWHFVHFLQVHAPLLPWDNPFEHTLPHSLWLCSFHLLFSVLYQEPVDASCPAPLIVHTIFLFNRDLSPVSSGTHPGRHWKCNQGNQGDLGDGGVHLHAWSIR